MHCTIADLVSHKKSRIVVASCIQIFKSRGRVDGRLIGNSESASAARGTAAHMSQGDSGMILYS